MSLKAFAAKIFAQIIARKTARWANRPFETQERVFMELVAQGRKTQFGRDHDFASITNPTQFKQRVPIKDYEALKPYVELIKEGAEDVLWPGKPSYFAKTSGTTSGAKYIPITKASIKCQVNASRNAILNYIHETGKAQFVDGKMIFLQGSPILKEINGIKLGRLSGISAHYVPAYLQRNRLPSWETNCIDDWETKVNTIVQETKDEKMSVIAGIPSWVQMYFERLKENTGKDIGALFPHFELFIYGGVNYGPYRKKFRELIGRKVGSIELFPASEGFFAYQDQQDNEGLLLLLDAGIYYEFIPVEQFHDPKPPRLGLEEVALDKDYAMVISTNAGLWGYNLGDTVRFVSLSPFRVVVSGRIKHFISAFGEHVIAKEVEQALATAIAGTDAQVQEFTVAPQITPEGEGLPYHEWFIEFTRLPSDMAHFKNLLDDSLQAQNSYYKDLIEGKILRQLRVSQVRENGFRDYMKSVGRLGGQNKVQRLANDRKMAGQLPLV